MVFSGISRDGRLVEFIELPSLKYFVGTQAHPELKSEWKFLRLCSTALSKPVWAENWECMMRRSWKANRRISNYEYRTPKETTGEV